MGCSPDVRRFAFNPPEANHICPRPPFSATATATVVVVIAAAAILTAAPAAAKAAAATGQEQEKDDDPPNAVVAAAAIATATAIAAAVIAATTTAAVATADEQQQDDDPPPAVPAATITAIPHIFASLFNKRTALLLRYSTPKRQIVCPRPARFCGTGAIISGVDLKKAAGYGMIGKYGGRSYFPKGV